jgi:hypothetical protein
VTDTFDLYQTDCSIYQHDCIQLSFNSTPPNAQVDIAEDPFMGCELGVALATVYPLDTLRDTLDSTLYTLVPDRTKVPDTTEAFTFWQPTNANSAMSLAPGDNGHSNSIVKGKAIHVTVEKTDDCYITRYEFALRRDDVNAGIFWSPFIRDNAIGRFSIMAMDHDSNAVDSLETVCWASGILRKSFNMFGSIKWSFLTPEGEELPSSVNPASKQLQERPQLGISSIKSSSFQITYNVIGNSAVRVDLFDCTGRLVRSLVNQKQAPGDYRVNLSTTGLSNGGYLCRLKANGTESIRKLSILR